MKVKSLAEKGFTLVEVVITLGIVSIVLLIVGNFAITSFAQSSVESAKADLFGESQIAMDRIITDIRLSSGAQENNRWPDANKSGGEYSWQSNGSSLVLAAAVVDSSNNIIFADASRYISEKNDIIYFIYNGTLYKRTIASPVAGNTTTTSCPSQVATPTCPSDRALLKNVTSFTLTYLNADELIVAPSDARAVELTVNTSTRKFSNDITSSYTTRAVFRNK